MESAPGPIVTINGKEYIYFAGTSYFQLHTHPDIIKAANEATLKYGISSATTRSITGTTDLIVKLEKSIADFFQTEDAVYLPSGYLVNFAGIQALKKLNLFDKIFIDENSHYCNIEAARVVGCQVISFKHLDSNDLEKKIINNLRAKEKPLIVSDGVFPVWGKFAPVDVYKEIAEKYDGSLWIDDAHGVGILGPEGQGIYDHFNLESDKLFMGATLAKAFGAYGGIIPGNNEFINTVRKGSILTGSSSPMAAAVAAGIQGIKSVKNDQHLHQKLAKKVRLLKSELLRLDIQSDNNDFPVVAFVSGNADNMMRIQKALMSKGLFIQFLKYKGAGENGVLRIVVTVQHETDQIQYLVKSLQEVI